MEIPEQKFYDIVADELRSKMIVDGVWVRAFAEAHGDEAKARAIYISYRVEQLRSEQTLAETRAAHHANLQSREKDAQDKERRERHFRTLAAARPPSSFDVYKSGAWFFLGLFVLSCATVGAGLFLPSLGKSTLLEIALVFFATITTVFSLARQLPMQNVLLAGAIIAFIGTIVHALGANTAIPFGPFFFNDDLRPRIGGVPWIMPFIWLFAVLNSRGVARLILRPWRKTRSYGWWVIGLTIVLCVLLDVGWEVFASRVKNYVFWGQTKFPATWHGVPLVNFLGWLLTLLLIMAFATPALINKAHKKSFPDYNPLIVWVMLNALFLTGAAVNQLWSAVVVTGATSLVAVIFAVRGARW